MTTKNLNKLIKEALDIANDLCYDEKCKADLLNAKNEIQIENILIDDNETSNVEEVVEADVVEANEEVNKSRNSKSNNNKRGGRR